MHEYRWQTFKNDIEKWHFTKATQYFMQTNFLREPWITRKYYKMTIGTAHMISLRYLLEVNVNTEITKWRNKINAELIAQLISLDRHIKLMFMDFQRILKVCTYKFIRLFMYKCELHYR